MNHQCQLRQTTTPVLYAENLIETVKIGLKHYRKNVLKSDAIGNVELILDVNNHNEDPEFDRILFKEKTGVFKGVKRIVKIDSAASRLLQLADVVAYSRKWIINKSMNAGAISDSFGIEIC